MTAVSRCAKSARGGLHWTVFCRLAKQELHFPEFSFLHRLGLAQVTRDICCRHFLFMPQSLAWAQDTVAAHAHPSLSAGSPAGSGWAHSSPSTCWVLLQLLHLLGQGRVEVVQCVLEATLQQGAEAHPAEPRLFQTIPASPTSLPPARPHCSPFRLQTPAPDAETTVSSRLFHQLPHCIRFARHSKHLLYLLVALFL